MRPQSTRICPICGNPFSRNGDAAWTKTCSRKCGFALRRSGQRDRFWSRVDRSSGTDNCWEWQASRSPFGYGHVYFDGRVQPAHRVAWQLGNGPIPDGLDVMHRCDNRACCNPAHLTVGTHADNMADMVSKGRSAQHAGTDNGRAVLNEDDVREIRRRYAAGGISQQALATEFGVTQMLVSKIVNRRLWKHVV